MRMTVIVVVVMVVVMAFVAALRRVAVVVAFAVCVGGVIVCAMSVVARMPMRALRMVAMIVACAVRVAMIVCVPMMFVEDLLRERVVLYERLIMPVFVTAAIRAGLRLERRRRAIHMRAQTLQHVFQHGVSFQFQLS